MSLLVSGAHVHDTNAGQGGVGPHSGYLPPITFRGAQVLMPDGLRQTDVTIADGVIRSAQGMVRNLDGYLILPGIIDLHGDGFERHLAPRRGALDSVTTGLHSVDAELAAHGITTAFLAQFFSWEGGMRGPDHADIVADAVAQTDTLTDLRLQLRVEMSMIDAYHRALSLIDRCGVSYVVFNDHLPHRDLARGKPPAGLTGKALKAGRSPQAHLEFLHHLHTAQPQVRPALAAFAETLRRRGVHLGSHDDTTPADRAWYRGVGAHIAEFPETRATALAAKAAGDAVVMGAPNVVRGGSHRKNQSAAALVADGAVDALVSDYHYPSLAQAAFKLVDGGMPWAAAWAMVSSGPADMLGMTDRGHIAPGLRADLVIVAADTRRVAGTLAAGRFSALNGALAARLIAG